MMHVPLLSRAIACVLLVCLPLQAMAIASARASGPAHVHLALDANGHDDHGHGEGDHGVDDEAHHDHHHHDGAVGHHAHDPQLPGVVYLEDDDKRSAGAATRLAGKRWLIDQESLAPPLAVESARARRPARRRWLRRRAFARWLSPRSNDPLADRPPIRPMSR